MEDAAHYHSACVDLTSRVDELNRALDVAEEENAALRDEIVHLKAKLYDYMVEGK